jgi:hypothetical protein
MNEISLFDSSSIDDGRGRYPDHIGTSVPRALGQVTRSVAAAQGVSVAEFARRALIFAIANPQVAIQPSPSDKWTGR